MEEKQKPRVCIVGCGPAGMSVLNQLGELSDGEMPDIVCYEKQSDWGGIWNVTWRTGTDEYGEQLHSSMYYDMWINLPKEIIEYPDYTFETHFQKPIPSYIPSSAMKDYILGRVTRGNERDLKQFIEFCSSVRRVDYDKDNDEFLVIVKYLKENVEVIKRFTHVVVATGQFSVPNMPAFPGLDDFRGIILHAKNVRHVGTFKGQRMLLVGSSFSAEDLALQSLKYGVRDITVTYRTQPLGYQWPKGIEERPLVQKFVGNKAYFKDGTSKEIDVVILCTGYHVEYPFLSEELRLKPTRLDLFPDNLYKGVLYLNGGNNKLIFVGSQYSVYILNMLDAQAVFARKIILGSLNLPSKEEMKSDVDKWVSEKHAITDHAPLDIFGFMTKYITDIVKAAGHREDVLRAEDHLVKMLADRSENILTWRDKQFKSIYTGTLSPPPKVPWMKNFDVSLEGFLDQCSKCYFLCTLR